MDYKKLVVVTAIVMLIGAGHCFCGFVNGYFRSDGTYVSGYWRSEPNYYKWDNIGFDGNSRDIYNDKSWYRDFGYDPEPGDKEIPNCDY